MRIFFFLSMYKLIVQKTPTKRKTIPKPPNRRETHFFGVIFLHVFHAVVEKNGETNVIYPGSINTIIVGNLEGKLKNT